MTRQDIIRMAREADLYLDGENLQQPLWVLSDKELERFAALVAAAAKAEEREACAKACEVNHHTVRHSMSSFECAAAIRARGVASIRSNT